MLFVGDGSEDGDDDCSGVSPLNKNENILSKL